jgi:protein-disulfide isomerase
LEKNLALGQSMGVQGTPAFFVGDEAIPGAPENLNKILSAAIKQTLAKGCSVC